MVKKILSLFVIVLFVSCSKEEIITNEIKKEKFSKEEIEALKNESSNYFDLINFYTEEIDTTKVEIKILENLYENNRNSVGLITFTNLRYVKESLYEFRIMKKNDGDIFYTGELYKENKVVYSKSNRQIEKIYLDLDRYFDSYVIDFTKKISKEDFLLYGQGVFGDEESRDESSILYSLEDRGFKMNEILSVKEVDKDSVKKIRVYNPLPHNFENIYIIGEVGGVEVILYIIEEVSEYSENFYPLTSHINQSTFNKLDGEKFESTNYTIENISLMSEDEVYNKLKLIKGTNQVSFKHHVNGGWIQLLGDDAKKYTPILANIYYMLSTDEFVKEFMKEENLFTGNDGTTLITASEKEEIYNRYLTNEIYLRLVEGVEGAAAIPGKAIGIGRHKFAQFYNRNGELDTGGVRTWAHEIAHNLGFKHTSNMTYAADVDADGVKDGSTIIWQKVYSELYSRGDLPFQENSFDENLLKSRDSFYLKDGRYME